MQELSNYGLHDGGAAFDPNNNRYSARLCVGVCDPRTTSIIRAVRRKDTLQK